MIELRSGNLLLADAEALVNTVNCVGVMGKGIALQFKQAFPENYDYYRKACSKNLVKPGAMLTYETGSMVNPRMIINFPTKRHWKGKSRLQDIELGLDALKHEVCRVGIKSIAIPPLGCGNGGLDWEQVRPLIEKTFVSLPDVKVLLYAPIGSPEPDQIVIRTPKPKLTRSRALLISLMEEYAVPGYRLSLLEVQKLAYFLQACGEPLRLEFIKHFYGPYAENLNHVLQLLDGHYILGYGDRTKQAQIRVLPNASQYANAFLENDASAKRTLQSASKLIRGFETPYGLELLSTVHWVVKQEKMEDTEDVIMSVHSWNSRKKKVFNREHILLALAHLRSNDRATDKCLR